MTSNMISKISKSCIKASIKDKSRTKSIDALLQLKLDELKKIGKTKSFVKL